MVDHNTTTITIMDTNSEEHYTCHHCNASIDTITNASLHECLKDKLKFYLVGNVFYGDDPDKMGENVDKENTCNKKNNPNALWTRNSTLLLLKLYEENIFKLGTPKNKTRVWDTIASNLKDKHINVTSDQIRWKMNSLIRKYRKCLEHNNSTVWDSVTFEYYDQMERITKLERQPAPKPFKANNIKITESGNHLNMKQNTSNDIESEIEGKLIKFIDYEREKRKRQNEKIIRLKRKLELKEQEIFKWKTIKMNELKLEEQKHNKLMKIERLKCNILKQILTDDHQSDTLLDSFLEKI